MDSPAVSTGYSSGHHRKNVLAEDFMQEMDDEDEVGAECFFVKNPDPSKTKKDVRHGTFNDRI